MSNDDKIPDDSQKYGADTHIHDGESACEKISAIASLFRSLMVNYSTLIKVMLAFCSFIISIYFFKEGFFYNSISISDLFLMFTLFFCFVTIFILLSFVSFMGAIVPIRLSFWVANKRNIRLARKKIEISKFGSSMSDIILSSFFMIGTIAGIIITFLQKDYDSLFVFSFFFIWGIFSSYLFFFTSSYFIKKNKDISLINIIFLSNSKDSFKFFRRHPIYIAASILPFLLSLFVIPSLINSSFAIIGLRSSAGDSIYVSKDVREKIENISSYYSIPIKICTISNSYSIIEGITVVWNGVGEKTYLKISGNSSIEAIMFSVNSDGLDLIRARFRHGDCSVDLHN